VSRIQQQNQMEVLQQMLNISSKKQSSSSATSQGEQANDFFNTLGETSNKEMDILGGEQNLSERDDAYKTSDLEAEEEIGAQSLIEKGQLTNEQQLSPIDQDIASLQALESRARIVQMPSNMLNVYQNAAQYENTQLTGNVATKESSLNIEPSATISLLDTNKSNQVSQLNQVIVNKQPIMIGFNEMNSLQGNTELAQWLTDHEVRSIIDDFEQSIQQLSVTSGLESTPQQSATPIIIEVTTVPLTQYATGKLAHSKKLGMEGELNYKAEPKSEINKSLDISNSYSALAGASLQMQSSSATSKQSLAVLSLNTQVTSDKVLRKALSEALPTKFNPAFQELLDKKFTVVVNSEGHVSIWYRDYFENDSQIKDMLERIQTAMQKKASLKQIVFNGQLLYSKEEQSNGS
jgi:hypothetical protein